MLESFITDKFEYKRIPVEEQKRRGILGRLVGVIADTNNATRNGRKYSEQLWENVFNDPIMQEKIKNRVCFGELQHPADREEIDPEKVAVCLAEQPKKGRDGRLYGVFDILSTPNGKILKSFCDYGCTVGISSRGTGDLYTDDDGNEAVDPDTYECVGWDVVLIPAVEEARLQYVTEALDTKKRNKTLKQKLTEELNKASDEEKEIMKETLTNLKINLTESRVLTKAGPTAEQEEHEIVDHFIDEKGERHLKLDNGKWITDKEVDSIEASDDIAINEPEPEVNATVTEGADEFTVDDWTKFVKYANGKGVDKNVLEQIREKLQGTNEDCINEDAGSRFEVLWYKDPEMQGDPETQEFNSKNAALVYYNAHKDEDGKYGWWVTERDPDSWEVIDDIDLNESYEQTDDPKYFKDQMNKLYHSIMTAAMEAENHGSKRLSRIYDNLLSEIDAYSIDYLDENCKNESCDEACSDKNEDCEMKDDADIVGDNLVEQLQEALVKASELEKDNLSLQEKLSVSNAKEIKLEEELKKYKASTASLSETAKDAKDLKEKVDALTEDLKRKEIILKSSKVRFENLNSQKRKSSKIIEESERKIKDLSNQIETLNKKLDESVTKLEKTNLIVKKYQLALKEAKNAYINVKADLTGVDSNQIKSKLRENYKLSDIDLICEDLSDFKRKMSKLPFAIGKDTQINFKSSENEYIKGAKAGFIDDDYVDDTLLRLANLK